MSVMKYACGRCPTRDPPSARLAGSGRQTPDEGGEGRRRLGTRRRPKVLNFPILGASLVGEFRAPGRAPVDTLPDRAVTHPPTPKHGSGHIRDLSSLSPVYGLNHVSTATCQTPNADIYTFRKHTPAVRSRPASSGVTRHGCNPLVPGSAQAPASCSPLLRPRTDGTEFGGDHQRRQR